MRFSQPIQERSTPSLYPVLFLVLAVLLVYCRAAAGTIVSIDDAGILRYYGSPKLSLWEVLSPGQGYYYRPVTTLSFYLDYRLFGQNPFLLHLENILIHAANTVLLFLLASRFLTNAPKWAPICAALLFGLHPVNCEAVSWIAGRTDPLAAFFLFSATLALCTGLERGTLRHCVYSLLLFIAAVMCKETAVMFMPASLLLLLAWRRLHPESPSRRLKAQGRLLCLAYLAFALCITVLLVSGQGAQSSLAKLLTGKMNGLWDPLLLGLQALGFYLKKMVAPWPLNFGIDEIAPWYGLVGAAGILYLVFAQKNRAGYLAVCTGVMFLLPAVVVASWNIAWTVVAERYLYIPSAFFSIGCTAYLVGAADAARRRKTALAVLGVCIAVSAAATAQRTGVWLSNLALFEDAVKKSPRFGMLHHELAVALAREGRLAEARRELDIAASLDISEMLKQMIEKSRLLIALEEASPEEKRRLLHRYGLFRVEKDRDLLTLLRSTDYQILLSGAEPKERDRLVAELVQVSERLYAITGDALLLYNNGQILLKWGDRTMARSYFVRSAEAAPEGIYYRAAAEKLAATLGEKR